MQSPLLNATNSASEEEHELWQTVAELEGEFDTSACEPVVPDSRPGTELDRDRLDEWKQYLFDLGYLDETPEQVQAEVYTQALLEAIDAFIGDARALFHEEVTELLEPEDEALLDGNGNTAPSPAARQLLASLLSFGGEVTLNYQPRLEESGLAVRLLHYRLKTLGLYSGDVGAPVSQDTFRSLQLLEAWFGEPALTHLGDAVKLLECYVTCRNATGREDEALLIAYDPETPDSEADAFGDLIYSDQAFRSDLWLFGKRFTDRERYHAIKREMASREAPRDRAERALNRAGLKVLQVALWSRGLYSGRLDDWWGSLSHRALMEALDLRDVDRQDAVRRLSEGFIAINLPRIARELAPPQTNELEALETHVHTATAESDLFGIDGEDRSVFRATWDRVKSGLRSALALGRRLATGVIDMLRTTVDACRRGFAWLRAKIGQLSQAVVSLVRSSFREVREAIRMLARSIRPFAHFILRKPLATFDEAGHPVTVTRFDADRDTLVWVARSGEREDIANHAALCRRLARALELVLTFAGKVVFYLVRGVSGPIGWLRIGLRIAAIFRQTVTPQLVRAVIF